MGNWSGPCRTLLTPFSADSARPRLFLMQMRGKMGRPARFSDTTEEQYTVIYFCPVPECDHSAEVTRRRVQVAVPGEAPVRPVYARDGGR